MEDYKCFNLKRASIKGRVTKFNNLLENLNGQTLDQTQIDVLKQRLVKIEALFIEFDSVQNQIEALDENGLSAELDIRETVEQSFYNCIAEARKFISMFSKTAKHSSELSNFADENDHEVIGFRLPVIKINKFDGTFNKWLEFRDTFSSLIHNNSKIKNIHKFHYLNSYLEGEAARVICNLEVSEVNYPEAWDLLCKRYNNTRQLINNHLKSLFNIEPLRESDKSLRFLADHVTKNLRALNTLKQPTEHWDTLIVHMVSSKLDGNTRVKWEEYIQTNVSSLEVPSLENFMTFIKGRADVLESVYRSKHDRNSKLHTNPSQGIKHNTVTHTKSFVGSEQGDSSSPRPIKCVFCNKDHRNHECSQFQSKSIDDRLAIVADLKLCHNCLRRGHNRHACNLPGTCKKCKRRHNTLLHIPTESNTNVTDSVPISMSTVSSSETLLCTALVDIINPATSEFVTTKALLDSGSQSSFITEALTKELNLSSLDSHIQNVVGIGNTITKLNSQRCNVCIRSKVGSFSTIVSCLVIPQISGKIPRSQVDISHINLQSIELADPNFFEPSNVGLLIGADLFWTIIGSKQRSLGSGNPILHDSRLGWLIAGPIHHNFKLDTMSSTKCNFANTMNDSSLVELHNNLKKFWAIESLPQRPVLTDQERACEAHFLHHTKRDQVGRFCVKLPLLEGPDCLGESYLTAKRRFLNLERRFRKQSKLKASYTDFIKEYSQLGHLSISERDQPELSYFVPHHPVIREASESTRLRVVFDASARTTSGLSVNDIQMIGPTVQDSLFNILIRFRQGRYVLSADIEKMYRQVLVDESDRNLQLILWRDAEDKPLQTLRLNTVTYGFASASYLATRCLWQVGEECNNDLIKTIIQKDFYVDDLLTSSDDEYQLCKIQELTHLTLAKAGFYLRKYRSNLPSILSSSTIQSSGNLTFSQSANTLGLDWNPSSDSLHFPITVKHSHVITKRNILSSTFKIFDPLGLLSLSTIIPKILIQTLWSLNLDWDDPAPSQVVETWKLFVEGLKSISSLSIPRWASIADPISVEMHCFCDASQRAYGACLYLRSTNAEGEVHVHLLCAKSRVAPASNPMTIPRLELSGALLAAEMSSAVTQALRRNISRHFYWTDSSVVLGWLRNGSSNLKTFVANRVAAIRELTDTDSWLHVPTHHNPADLLSRGVNPQQVATCDLWWHGPNFLSLPRSHWPCKQTAAIELKNLPELKAHPVAIYPDLPTIDFNKYSKLRKLQRIVGYVYRFANNCKNSKSKSTGSLSTSELDKALYLLVYISQLESFSKEYDMLSKGNSLNPKSNVAALNPFLHEKIMRVGGRIQASQYSFDMKHPILLSPNHNFTKLLFQQEHERLLHVGPQALLCSIRARFWPIGGRNLARSVVNNCTVCRRCRGQTMKNIMGNLPAQRLTPDFPFATVGTDFAGPFLITDRKGRGCKITKCYLCVFVCFRYKCIHLEAVSELSKDAFLLALKRFISRRGMPKQIFCDNGSNFVAASRELGEFLKSNSNHLTDFAANEGIEFRFSPAYAPHFNGLMEAGVKSAKFHLTRILGTAHLTYEELSSLFAQIESILNSRPLCPLSSSPTDYYPLTPGHFLIGRPLTSLPTPDYQDINVNRLDRFKRLEQLKQHFWQRWSREYIADLQIRTKWRTRSCCLQEHDLVLLKEENTPPLYWRLGRVTTLFPGSDGVVRVADVTTARGVVRRALNRIVALPKPESLTT